MIDDEKCSRFYDELDKYMAELCEKHNPNFFELIHVLAMLDTKVRQTNITNYLVETVEEYAKQKSVKPDHFK